MAAERPLAPNSTVSVLPRITAPSARRCHAGGVTARAVSSLGRGVDGGGHACHVDHVLHRYRYAVQRALRRGLVQCAGLLQCLIRGQVRCSRTRVSGILTRETGSSFDASRGKYYRPHLSLFAVRPIWSNHHFSPECGSRLSG